MQTILSLLTLSASVSASSVWTVNCAPLTVQRSDPLFSPGEPSSHVHAVVGSTAFSRSMPGKRAAADGARTTCDKPTDHSNYWAPQLYQMLPGDTFKALPFTGMVAYYTNYTCDWDESGTCPESGRNPRAFPTGLRMIAGNPFRRTLNMSDPWEAAILMESGNEGEVYGMPTTLSDRLSGHVRFPSCWDGVHLDSEDHFSHVNYPDPALGGNTQGGMCPQSHPVAMINIGAEFGWSTEGVTDVKSLVWAQGDTTGYGFHADFVMGWKNPKALRESFANCFDNVDCPWRSFGIPDGQEISPEALAPQVPAPREDVGLVTPVKSLPGDNPVYKVSKLIAIRGRMVIPAL